MDYINTRPPVTSADIDNLTARMKTVKTRTIDGIVLSNLVRVCHECALKKGELIALSVGDVAKGGVVGDVIQIGESEVTLLPQAKQVLQDHIDYLKNNGYRMYPTYPLFPTGDKKRYTDRNLDNHMKEAQNAVM